MVELDPRALPSGATAVLETHVSPEGLSGVVAHWGERLTIDEVHQRLVLQGIEENKLSTTSGFDTIYHQADNIQRAQAIKDELVVAEMVGNTTIEANGWLPTDVDALYLGSGVPVVDDPIIDNYAGELARRMGMRENVKVHSTYAACTSGTHEFFHALTNPDLQGKKVLVMGMEGVTALTPNFDINQADSFSIQVFSNGAAGIGIIPGEDVILHSYAHRVVEDSGEALAAHMTYERLLDPKNSDIWQEDVERGLHLIRYPKPEDGKLLTLNQRNTSMFFIGEMVIFVEELYKEHRANYPDKNISFVVAHHASKPINDGLVKRLGKKGVIDLPMPWVVNDGNSSAATTLIAQNRLLSEARAGTFVMVVGYGAGGSFDRGIIEHRPRRG